MVKRSGIKKPDEVSRLARIFMDLTTGNPISEDISPIADVSKNPAAVVVGRKGGNTRTGSGLPERRDKTAGKAAKSRGRV